MASVIRRLAYHLLPKALLGRIHVFLLNRNLQEFPVRRVRHSYGGVELNIEISDPMAASWYDWDRPPLPELQLLADALKTSSMVFDLGAHQAVVALQLARAVGDKGKVLALEPNPHNVRAARKNKELNGAENLQILPAAVAEVSGPIVFNYNLNGAVEDGSGRFGKISVDGWSIDDLAEKFGTPDVLYLDVEGYEVRSLKGARKVLAGKPHCFVEVHADGHLKRFGNSVEQLLSFFPASEYELWAYGEKAEADKTPRRLDPQSELLKGRFFLIAIAKKSD